MPAIPATECPPELSRPSIADISGPWAVVCTKSRQEKALAQFLQKQGLDYYLPYIESATGALLPMFSGMFFVAYPSQNAYELDLIRSTQQFFRFLFTDNQPRLKRELAFIASESAQTRSIKLEAVFPRKGVAVRFASTTPYANLEGIIDRVAQTPQGKARVFVMLSLMGQPVSKEVDLVDIEEI